MAETLKIKIGKKTVDGLAVRDKLYVTWDVALSGFAVKVYPTNRKVYVYKYRAKGMGRRGVTKWATLGQHGKITAEQARDMAKELAAQIEQGQDPQQEQRKLKQQPDMTAMAERYLIQHARPHKKPKSVAEDERLLNRNILPALGKMKIGDVTRQDVETLKHNMAETPVMANRVLALLSVIFRLAEEWQLRSLNSNPCTLIKRYREKKRGALLSDEQLAALGKVLREEERKGSLQKTAVQAIRLVLFTGCRHNEICKLLWRDVDLKAEVLRLKNTKSGDVVKYLSPPALEILHGITPQNNNPYVFVGKEQGKALYGLGAQWRRIRARASLPDIRVHDLRHNMGNRSAEGIGNLTVMRDLMGHQDTSTTARFYTNYLSNAPVKRGNDQLGEAMSKALDSGDDVMTLYQ